MTEHQTRYETAIELGILAATRVVQVVAGSLAEPIATMIARPLLRDTHRGERFARRVGLSWQLHLANNLERRLYFARTYESATLREAVSRLRPGDVVLDVGANIGTFALPLASAGAAVIAVEPASDTSARLRNHVVINDLVNRVQVKQIALGNSRTQLELRVGSKKDTGLRTLTGGGEVIEVVEVITGDELLQNLAIKPDIVKIDVEGAELMVLRGMPNALRNARLLFVELVVRHQARAGETVTALVEHLRDFGFTPWHIRIRGLEPWTGQPGNAMFVRSGQ